MKKATLILLTARDVLASGAWTQETAAIDAKGSAAFISDPTACAWCAYGAIYEAANKLELMETLAIARAALELVCGDVPQFNDESKSAKRVIAAFDKAIEQLES